MVHLVQNKFNVFSTFTGAGGFDIGFHGDFNFLGWYLTPLNFETIYVIEINKDACDSLNNNVINKDITTVNIFKFNDEIDVLTGGFPCLSFSMLGKRLGVNDDLSGKLYETFVDFIEELKPKIFIGENVKGILSANKGEAI